MIRPNLTPPCSRSQSQPSSIPWRHKRGEIVKSFAARWKILVQGTTSKSLSSSSFPAMRDVIVATASAKDLLATHLSAPHATSLTYSKFAGLPVDACSRRRNPARVFARLRLPAASVTECIQDRHPMEATHFPALVPFGLGYQIFPLAVVTLNLRKFTDCAVKRSDAATTFQGKIEVVCLHYAVPALHYFFAIFDVIIAESCIDRVQGTVYRPLMYLAHPPPALHRIGIVSQAGDRHRCSTHGNRPFRPALNELAALVDISAPNKSSVTE